MSEGFQKIVEDTIMGELNKKLEEVNEEKFIELNKFDIKKEKVFFDFDICPNCKGKGGEWRSIYHNDVEWNKCRRCNETGLYVEDYLTKYFDRV